LVGSSKLRYSIKPIVEVVTPIWEIQIWTKGVVTLAKKKRMVIRMGGRDRNGSAISPFTKQPYVGFAESLTVAASGRDSQVHSGATDVNGSVTTAQ
jgi:hypothetical protein